MSTTKLFKLHTQDEHADSIADQFPNDKLFRGKKISGTKMRELLLGLAKQLVILEQNLELAWEEVDVNTTTDLIEEWEAALGIPDGCFFGERTIEVRRRDVLIKLSSSVQTAQDYVDLAALVGLTVIVEPGVAVISFPLTFPILFLQAGEQRFTLVVKFQESPDYIFPLTFPITFPEDKITLVKCLFNKLKPANVNIVYQQI